MARLSHLGTAVLLVSAILYAFAVPVIDVPEPVSPGWPPGLRYQPFPSWWVDYIRTHPGRIRDIMKGNTIIPARYLSFRERLAALEKTRK